MYAVTRFFSLFFLILYNTFLKDMIKVYSSLLFILHKKKYRLFLIVVFKTLSLSYVA